MHICGMTTQFQLRQNVTPHPQSSDRSVQSASSYFFLLKKYRAKDQRPENR
jgi:hypothetical protein